MDARLPHLEALDVLGPEAAASYLSQGDALPKAEVLRQMNTDYLNALRRLYDDAAEHLGIEEAERGWPHGLADQPIRLPDTPIYQLRSLAFEDTENLFMQGEPEQAFIWAKSDGSRFLVQTFRREEVKAWAENRGFWRVSGPDTSKPLNRKEKSTLLAIIGLLARVHGLPLDRHSTAAAQLLEEAGRLGLSEKISKRSLEMHFKEAFDEVELQPKSDAN